MDVGQILVLWLGIMAATVFPILLVLWIVYVIREPGRKRAERERLRSELLAWCEMIERDRDLPREVDHAR